MTFSIEIANAKALSHEGHHVEIYIDRKELKDLITRLEHLSNSKTGEDLHLMTESWGLGDLTEEIQGSGNVLTHHLKVILCD